MILTKIFFFNGTYFTEFNGTKFNKNFGTNKVQKLFRIWYYLCPKTINKTADEIIIFTMNNTGTVLFNSVGFAKKLCKILC